MRIISSFGSIGRAAESFSVSSQARARLTVQLLRAISASRAAAALFCSGDIRDRRCATSARSVSFTSAFSAISAG
jgi:hypothetical protein